MSLTYAPTQAGLLAADLRVESNATSSPLIARITGVAVTSIVAMSAAPLDFGRHPLGSYSWQSFVVNNTGAVSLTIAAVTLTDGAARLHHHQRHVLVAGRRAGGIVRRSTALHTHTDRCRERRDSGAS